MMHESFICDFFATYIRSDIMRASIPINRLFGLLLVFALSISSLSAREEQIGKILVDQDNDFSQIVSSRHPYQLIPSEGRPSYEWVVEHENEQVKLKYAYQKSLPYQIDFSQDLCSIHTQGELGSCTAQAVTFSMEYFLKKLDMPAQLSPLYVYYNERKLNGTLGEDIGASLSDAIQAINQYGVCYEQTWTYSDDDVKFKVEPSKNAYQEGSNFLKELHFVHSQIPHELTMIKQVLAQKVPIVFGINIFPSFEYEKVKQTGIVKLPKNFEKPIGAHALTLVGYNDEKQQFKFANSWGTTWGDNGYGYLPYDYLFNKNPNNIALHTYPRELWSIALSKMV